MVTIPMLINVVPNPSHMLLPPHSYYQKNLHRKKKKIHSHHLILIILILIQSPIPSLTLSTPSTGVRCPNLCFNHLTNNSNIITSILQEIHLRVPVTAPVIFPPVQ